MNVLSYDQIMCLVQRGIIPRKYRSMMPIDFAYDKGLYMGYPRKELHCSILSFDQEKQQQVMSLLVDSFQQSATKSVHFSVFWRYFYNITEMGVCMVRKKI